MAINTLLSMGKAVNDRGSVWQKFGSARLDVADKVMDNTIARWATGVAVSVGDRKRIDNGNVYICITAGTTGATEPSGTGTNISDGGATWDYDPHGVNILAWADHVFRGLDTMIAEEYTRLLKVNTFENGCTWTVPGGGAPEYLDDGTIEDVNYTNIIENQLLDTYARRWDSVNS